jgi:TRAP-type C4-dicarboxylate transport system substrate-binding protein
MTVHALSIKLGSLAPDGSPWDKALKEMAVEWKRISGGKIKVKIYPGGIAGDEQDMIRKMRLGQIHAAGITGVGLSRIARPILTIHYPLLFKDKDELQYVLDRMKPDFEKMLEEKGFKIIMWSTIGWVHFFSKKPVRTPDDLRAQKMFVWAGDTEGVQAWKEMGFQPIPLAMTDMMSSLQSGMVNAFTANPLSAASYQWFALANNMCALKWAPLLGGIVVSERTWKKIPDDLHPKLIRSAQKIGATLQDEIEAADAEAIEVMKKHGLVINEVSEKQYQQWKELVEAGAKKLIGTSLHGPTLKKIKQYLIEYRTRHDTSSPGGSSEPAETKNE